ncbi:ClpA/ClpB-like protein [Nocardia tenerifensis]|uniref:ClpA/ClpB-like protein n=1 Tax=Nocardia tenerifensis TaxID=228006 RepID=A0A318K6C4_9NOCA|nr:Clp protease N-terminal domain-containing protein [Nocardia tenerifensis]PXX65086.1 ClpA/ClpB-like protein [Nocardia tenerifensis]
MTSFDEYLHTVLTEGGGEAQRDGSATIEAQHLLLAIAAQVGTEPQRMLASVGLDHQALRDALHREFEHSLGAAGVSLAELNVPRAQGYRRGNPNVGASTKLALERGFHSVARKRDLQPAHLLLGILRAEVGTVPRTLVLAGVDRAELQATVERALAAA